MRLSESSPGTSCFPGDPRGPAGYLESDPPESGTFKCDICKKFPFFEREILEIEERHVCLNCIKERIEENE